MFDNVRVAVKGCILYMVLLSSLSFRTNIWKNIGVAWWPMRFQPHPPLNGSIHKFHCDWENIKKVAATVKIKPNIDKISAFIKLVICNSLTIWTRFSGILRDSPHVWARDFLPSRSKPHSGNVWHADLGLWMTLGSASDRKVMWSSITAVQLNSKCDRQINARVFLFVHVAVDTESHRTYHAFTSPRLLQPCHQVLVWSLAMSDILIADSPKSGWLTSASVNHGS